MMIRGLQTGSGGSKGLIVGNIASGWTPVRNPQSKYFITEEQYAEASYPPFATGPSYLGGNQVKYVLLPKKSAWKITTQQ